MNKELNQQCKEQQNQIQQLQEQINNLKKKQQELILKEEQHQNQLKNLTEENKQKIDQMHQNVIEMLEQCKKENASRINEKQTKIDNLENELNQSKQRDQQSIGKIEAQIKQLADADKEISKQVQCTFCSKPLDQPATIIPCGHSYCLKCKQGYDKGSCYKCGPKVKIDSIYRNELMDDILNLLKLIRNSRQLLQEKFEQSDKSKPNQQKK